MTYRVHFSVLRVDGCDQHVVGDVVQVSAVFQPGSSGRDVIGGALALDLHEDDHALKILAVPGLERFEQLQAQRFGVDVDLDGRRVAGGLVRLLTSVESARGELVSEGVAQHELLAVGTDQFRSARIEIQGSGQGQRSRQFGGGDEAVSGGVGVVTGREVAVVRRDDRVLLALLHVLTVPLTDAGTASVGQNGSAELAQRRSDAVAFDGGADLFRSGRDVEGCLGLQSVVQSLAGDAGAATHVFVARVGAAANQRHLDVQWPVVLLGGGSQLRDDIGQIGGEGSVDVGLQFVQVDLKCQVTTNSQ